jgi:hypothetical protein
LVRIRALERQIPEELAEADEQGIMIDHLRDERFLTAELIHAGNPEIVIAIGFGFAACAAVANAEGSTIEALLELDESQLDASQRERVEWLLETLRRVAGRERVKSAPPAEFEELLRIAVALQQN